MDILVVASGVDGYSLAGKIRRSYRQRLDERIDVTVVGPEVREDARGAFVRTLRKVKIR